MALRCGPEWRGPRSCCQRSSRLDSRVRRRPSRPGRRLHLVEARVNVLGLLENGLFAVGQILRLPVMVLLWCCVAASVFLAGGALVEFAARRRERSGFNINEWLRAGPVLGADAARVKHLPSALRHLLAEVETRRAGGMLADGGLEHVVLAREDKVKRVLTAPRMLV